MKKNNIYIYTFLCMLATIGIFVIGCSDENEYSDKTSFYDNMTFKVKNLEQDNILSIERDTELMLPIEITPEEIILDSRAFYYLSSDTSVFKINETGNITALKRGTAELQIKFRANNNITSSCTVVVYKDVILVEEIVVPNSVKNSVVQIGKTFDLSTAISVKPANAEFKKLTYKSNNESIATIDEKGVITGVAEGAVSILMTTTDGSEITAECPITIVPEIKVSELIVDKILDVERNVEVGQLLNLASFVHTRPETASNKELKIELISGNNAITLNDNKGAAKAVGVGTARIKATTTDGSNVSVEYSLTVVPKVSGSDLDRSLWRVTTKYPYSPDGSTGLPEHMFDDKANTFMSIGKPGRGAPKETEVYFTLELAGPSTVSYFRIKHRDASRAQLKVWEVTIQGSNDGETFTDIVNNYEIKSGKTTTVLESEDLAIPKTTYQYYRFYLTDWNKTSGNSMQIAELNLGDK